MLNKRKLLFDDFRNIQRLTFPFSSLNAVAFFRDIRVTYNSFRAGSSRLKQVYMERSDKLKLIPTKFYWGVV